MNYRKEQRNRRDITAEETKETEGFHTTFSCPQDIGRSGSYRYLERKKTASRLNNGKIWDFYSLQSNYGVSKRLHYNFL